MRRSKNQYSGGRTWAKRVRRLVLVLLAVMFLPLTVSYGIRTAEGALHWSQARRDSSRQAPDPAHEFGPVVQVYAGRAWGWRGAFGVHTWIATKRRGADHYVRHEVIGWGVRHGADAVRVGRGVPDTYWFGSKPVILTDLRGPDAEGLIDQIEAAGGRYPYQPVDEVGIRLGRIWTLVHWSDSLSSWPLGDRRWRWGGRLTGKAT